MIRPIDSNTFFPWHKRPWQIISNALAQDRLPHALLLSGPNGMGKSFFAEKLAQLLLCVQPNDLNACQQCASCHLTLSGNNPDFLKLIPEKEGGAIAVDAVRRLYDFLGKSQFANASRLIIIEPADALNTASKNALLKNLEEPPPNTLFILVTSRAQSLPQTIRSRCQTIIFTPVMTEPASLAFVAEYFPNIDPTVLLQQTQGAPLAISGLLDTESLERRQLWTQQLTALLEATTTVFQAASACVDIPLGQLLVWMQSLCEDALYRLFGGEITQLQNRDLSHLLPRIHAEPSQFFSLISFIQQHRQHEQHHLNQLLVTEDLFIRWQSLKEKRS